MTLIDQLSECVRDSANAEDVELKCEDCGKRISGADVWTVVNLAYHTNWTVRRYDDPVCGHCSYIQGGAVCQTN